MLITVYSRSLKVSLRFGIRSPGRTPCTCMTICFISEIDHCSPSPCERGTCENLPSDYKCHCPPGYIGDHCEEGR